MTDRERLYGVRRHPKMWLATLMLTVGTIALAGCASSPSNQATGTGAGGNGGAAALGTGNSGSGGGGSGAHSGNGTSTGNGSASGGKSGATSGSSKGSGGKNGSGSPGTGGSSGGGSTSSGGGSTNSGSGGTGGGSTGGGTFNVPAGGGNVFTASPGTGGTSTGGGANPAPSPALSPKPCVLPADPSTVAQGITGGHMDSIDSAGNAHGPASTFSAASVQNILAVLYLSGLVTGTVITYVEVFCGTTIASQDFTLSSNNSTALFAFNGNPTFNPGLYRMLFYVNTKTNSAPAFVMDFTFTA